MLYSTDVVVCSDVFQNCCLILACRENALQQKCMFYWRFPSKWDLPYKCLFHRSSFSHVYWLIFSSVTFSRSLPNFSDCCFCTCLLPLVIFKWKLFNFWVTVNKLTPAELSPLQRQITMLPVYYYAWKWNMICNKMICCCYFQSIDQIYLIACVVFS